jgi:multidrug efflux pump subunit AcrA (membrane-fusion protein)
MKRRVALVSCLLAGALAACDAPKQARQEAPPRPVLVAAVHYQPRERAQALPGVVKARTESELAFRVGGRLEVRLVDSGAFVRKGETLAFLDRSDFQLQLEQAQAELASARAALVQSEAEEKRITSLTRQGWSANADFDKAKSTADQGRSAV